MKWNIFSKAKWINALRLRGHLSDIQFKSIIFPEAGQKKSDIINQTQFTQPLLFMVEYALARLLMHWGVNPDIMIGHSIGEYTASIALVVSFHLKIHSS